MKYLLITLLFTLNVQAQTLVKIIPNNSKLASMQLEEKNLNKAVKRLKRIVTRSSWLKGEYKEVDNNSIFTREKTRSVATGNMVDSTDIDGETISVPEFTEETYLEYFIAENFTVTFEDVTQEKANKEKEIKDDKKEVKRLRLKIDALSIDEDLKKLLKKLVKSCLKE